MSPKCYIDMAHPWDTANPTEIRKVCDVFGVHWYQSLTTYNGSELVPIEHPTSGTLPWSTWIWSSDRLQAFTSDECNPISWHIGVCPQTIWMADKPIIITETQRYDYNNYDAAQISLNNYTWYTNYLQYGETRHIESFVFWSGDGGLKHLVDGDGSGWTYGWKAFHELYPVDRWFYNLGNGGTVIKNYTYTGN